MNRTLAPPDWAPVEIEAREMGISAAQLIQWIEDGSLEGERFADGWYVAPPMVSLVPPEPPSYETAGIAFRAYRLGPYLTAGRAWHVFKLPVEGAGPRSIRAQIERRMKTTPELPLPIELAGEPLLIDSTLWCDLAAVLVSLEVLHTGAIDGIPVSENEEPF